MPARIQNSGNQPEKQMKAPRVQVKAPAANNEKIQEEMKAALANNIASGQSFSNIERAQFYAGHDRLNLQGPSVQRVRELQEENDHLQREIVAKEKEIAAGADPLVLLADIEHRKVLVARNTGEILKIYLRNDERMKRIKELESHNTKIQNDMMEMQNRFISTTCMDEKTKFASEFFIMKSQIERNVEEINNLSEA